MVLPDKKAPTTKICRNTKKEMTFSPRTIANIFEKHLANLQVILLRNFFTLQANLQYCASITTDLTSVKKTT